jgi:CBS domain-containing protein
MLVRECLHRAPVTVPPECTIEEAAHLMANHRVGSLLVVRGGELQGIVTDRDIVVRGIACGQTPDSHINAVMTESPTVIQGSADVLDAFKILKDIGVRRLPVLEENDVAGIITVDDLLVHVVVELAALTSPIVGESNHQQTAL